MALREEFLDSVVKCTDDELIHGLIISAGNTRFVENTGRGRKNVAEYTEEKEACKAEVIQRLENKGKATAENLQLVEDLIAAKVEFVDALAAESGSDDLEAKKLVTQRCNALLLILK